MNPIHTPFSKEDLLPKEETLEVLQKKGCFKIGIPKETDELENRICLTPDAVETLILQGHQITIERDAGIRSNYSNQEYAESGAVIYEDRQTVLDNPIVLKIAPLTEEEIPLIKTIVISELQAHSKSKSYLEKLLRKKIIALAFELIADQQQQLPLVRLLGEITGTSIILITSELMASNQKGSGLLMGSVAGLSPTEVVIIGARTVGEYATKAALGLGTSVRVFDNSVSRLRRLQNILGQKISTSTLDPKELKKALMRCDVAIGALRSNVRYPNLVQKEMVSQMKEGAIILDVSINIGGCFETSEITNLDQSTINKHGVIHYGAPNITSKYARTTSKALSNYFLGFLQETHALGRAIQENIGTRKGVYIYKGKITNKQVSFWFDLPYTDLNLLLY